MTDPQRAPALPGSIGMPLIFLGLFPAVAFSAPMQGLLNLLPSFFVTNALRAITQGTDLSKLSTDLLGLIVWGLAIVVASGRAFRWS